jgi:hypothetical protein
LKLPDKPPASPQKKKAARGTGAGDKLPSLPTPPIPDPLLVQRPEHLVPPATMPGYLTNASVFSSPSSAPVKHPTTLVRPTWSIGLKPQPSLTDMKPGNSIPLGFEPLVRTLDMYRTQGVLRPFRSRIGAELATQAIGIYRRVGVERFGQYVDLAVKAGIVELGGKDGGAWIALRPASEWYTNGRCISQPAS